MASFSVSRAIGREPAPGKSASRTVVGASSLSSTVHPLTSGQS